MMVDECIHGLGPVTSCTLCNGRDKRERAEEAARPRVFPARYDGYCPECNLPIHVGQMIAWQTDEAAVHEGCA